MPHQRQIQVEQILGGADIARTEQTPDLDQHVRIGKSGHCAVSAARQLLRKVETAVADQNADPPVGTVFTTFANFCQLLQAGTVLMLEHHDLREEVDDALDRRRREVDVGGLRVVLQNDRNAGSQLAAQHAEIVDDLLVGTQPRDRRHHDAGCAFIHDKVGKLHQRIDARITHPHHDRHIAGPRQHSAGDRPALILRKLRGLSHHAKDRDALDTASDVRVDRTVDARQINAAVVGKRRRCDHVNAFGALVQQCHFFKSFSAADEQSAGQGNFSVYIRSCNPFIPSTRNPRKREGAWPLDFPGVLCQHAGRRLCHPVAPS